jgi:hypothetical protein
VELERLLTQVRNGVLVLEQKQAPTGEAVGKPEAN